MIYINYSRPERNEEMEARIRKELQQLDSLLDIYWHPTIYWNEREQTFEGRYLLICWWPSSDKRRGNQKTPEDKMFDIMGAFCTDIEDASSVPQDVESMMPLIYERLGKADGDRMPHAKRLAQILQRNSERHAKLKQQVVDEAVDEALYNRNQIYKIQSVNVPVQLEK